MAAKKIALINTSTRPVRIGPSVVSLVHKVFEKSSATPKPELSTLDVADFNLPVFNEKMLPAMVPGMGQFEHEHSKKWSAAIAQYDGYVFFSPEYNFGVPGGVKNAIDYLYNDWIGKPILIVTYGIHGAQEANKALNIILKGMKLRVIPTSPELKFAEGQDQVFAAAGGSIAEKTLKEWEASDNKELLKGFGELVEELEKPAPAPTAH